LLRSLMGSVFEDEEEKPDEDKGQGWMAEEGDLVGWPREELLKEVVLILGKFMRFLHTHVCLLTSGCRQAS
jgi:protein HIRA/HIR1